MEQAPEPVDPLSEGDRARIRAEEEYRAQVRAEINSETAVPPPATPGPSAGFVGCLVILAIMVIAGWWGLRPSSQIPSPPARRAPGSITNIDAPTACFPTEAGLDVFTRSAARGDREEAARTVINHRGQMLDKGYAVKVLDLGVLTSRIRLTDTGAECFVATDLLRR